MTTEYDPPQLPDVSTISCFVSLEPSNLVAEEGEVM